MSRIVALVATGGRTHALRRMRSGVTSHRAFLGAVAAIVAACAALTIALCGSMVSMGEVPMAGGWAMSMTWFRMPEQTWAGAAAAFVAMWVAMMVAMMLPLLAPVVLRVPAALGAPDARHGARLWVVLCLGYFAVWVMAGLGVFALGATLGIAAVRMPALARMVPVAGGVVVVLAGALQFSAWRTRHLGSLRTCSLHGTALVGGMRAAWRLGIRLGVHCTACCAGSTAVLLALGVNDLRAMGAIAASIAAERFTRNGRRIARTLGFAAMACGAVMIARAVGPH